MISKGIISLIGGILILMVLSAHYTYGLIFSYLSSNLRNHGQDVTTADVNIVTIIGKLSHALAVWLGSRYSGKFQENLYATVCIVMICFVWFSLSFTTNYYLLIFFMGIILRFFEGALYLLPVNNLQKHFPKNQGTMCGILFLGYGIGNFIWNPLLFYLINPENIKGVKDPETKEKYFDTRVTENIPYAFRVYALVLIITGLIGCFLLRPSRHINNEDNKQLQKKDQKPVMLFDRTLQAFKSKPCLEFVGLFLSAIGPGFFIAYNYKTYGHLYIHDDSFFYKIGMAKAVSNGAARFFWGFVFDKFNFKTIICANMVTQLVLVIVMQYIVSIKYLYMTVVFFLVWNFAGWWVIGPSYCSRTFGFQRGKKIYGIIFQGSIFGTFLQYGLVKWSSWTVLFWMYTGILCIGTVIAFIGTFQFSQESIEAQQQQLQNKNDDDNNINNSSSAPSTEMSLQTLDTNNNLNEPFQKNEESANALAQENAKY